MIHRIYSNLESFRELRLAPGLNVLVADKREESTDRQTRNGAGKTSLVELIHFLLGEKSDKNSIFRSEKLAPWWFGLDFDLSGTKVSVKRSGSTSAKVEVADVDIRNRPSQAPLVPENIEQKISNQDWIAALGEKVFSLPVHKPEDWGQFGPTFRSLFPYFVRRKNTGGFTSHELHFSQQPRWNHQVSISYLLGLDWSLPQRFQYLREQENTIKILKKSIRHGSIPSLKPSAASLRSQVASAEFKARNLKQQLDSFNIVPEYKEIELEATKLTHQMNRKGNENTADLQLLEQLNNSIDVERAPETSDLGSLYKEVGIVLPDLVTQHYRNVTEFHRVVIENRKAHLRSEIERVQQRVTQRDKDKTIMGERKAQLMEILRSGGALEQYTLLQKEYSHQQALMETLKQQLVLTEKLESEQTNAGIERMQLKERLRQDFHEQETVLNEAIVLFEELSETLYERERTGTLTIGATENGPSFEVKIDAQRSDGINKMQIFCFDMTLAVIASRRDRSTGFLVHDSHLFDGVDERQVAKALQIGKVQAEACGFQYIVTMNSDDLPRDGFDAGFDIRKYMLPVTLDDTPRGGLFGFRFN